MYKCDICNNICKKNKFGSSVYFCKTDVTSCINCSNNYRIYLKLKNNKKLFNYIIKRQIKFKHNI